MYELLIPDIRYVEDDHSQNAAGTELSSTSDSAGLTNEAGVLADTGAGYA